MRALFLIAALSLAGPTLAAGRAADAIAEKFARASSDAVTPATPAPDTAENDRRAALSAAREAETLRLAERLREARRAKAEALAQEEQAARQAHSAAQPTNPPAGSCPKDQASAEQHPQPNVVQPKPAATPTHASVLLALDPGTYGIRRFNHAAADPVLCIGDTCYISQGAAAPAKPMPRYLALGPGNTLGNRAGACRLQLTCVFRDIPLPAANTEIQPVDLHVLRHDRRETAPATPDATCRTSNGTLSCLAPVRALTWRALIVPETTASAAGPSALTAALATGLPLKAAAAY